MTAEHTKSIPPKEFVQVHERAALGQERGQINAKPWGSPLRACGSAEELRVPGAAGSRVHLESKTGPCREGY